MSDSLICGIHAVDALLRNPHRTVKKIVLHLDEQNHRLRALYQLAAQQHITIDVISLVHLDQQFGELHHQGVVAYATPLPQYSEKDLPGLLQALSPNLILILDGVTDPHNLGACLRVADGAGVQMVIIPKDKNASITPTVSKVASGAAENIPLVRVTNLVRAIELLKQAGIWVYGAAGETTNSLYALDGRAPIALIMGAEDKGLRRLTREHCDGLFALPMQGSVNSLNVSVAAGVCLYEIVRQRLQES